MTHHQLMLDFLSRRTLAVTPVSFWRHFPNVDQDAASLAQATIEWQKKFDFDFVKVTPASSFCVKDWGSTDHYADNPLGIRTYGNPSLVHPEEWSRLQIVDPASGHLGEQMKVLKNILNKIGNSVPVIQSVFSPLIQLENLAGLKTLSNQLILNDTTLKEALEVITTNTINFIDEAFKAGIDGIYYIIKHPSPPEITTAAYNNFGLPYDLKCLAATCKMWLNILHFHTPILDLNLYSEFTNHVISLHHSDAVQMKNLTSAGKLLCGGLNREVIRKPGNKNEITELSNQFLKGRNENSLVLSANCGLYLDTPEENIRAAISAARTMS